MSGIPEAYRSKTQRQALAHLAEELAEAMTAAAKALRFGPECVNPELPPDQQETNAEWLDREMQDVARAWEALRRFEDFGTSRPAARGGLGEAMFQRNISTP